MNKLSDRTSFGELFKKYRLRSEIETLSEFGDLLAEEGIVYETSLFTRWQNGERTPRDRKTVVSTVSIFIKHRGINSIDDANRLMESAGQRDLLEDEIREVHTYLLPQKNSTLPDNPEIFIGRSKLIKDISWKIINKKHMWLYGLPGVGKTSLALHIAHLLTDIFKDGIFWFRADIKDPQLILDELLNNLGYDPQGVNNVEVKLKKLSQLVQRRNILLILDNISLNNLSSIEIKYFLSLPLPIILTSLEVNTNGSVDSVKIHSFNNQEFIDLAQRILGKPFVVIHKKQIEELGVFLGYLPISSAIVLKQIFLNPLQVQKYITQIKQKSLDFTSVTYDNKNLYSAFEFSFDKLSLENRKILISCSLFDGTDFSVESLGSLNNFNNTKIKSYLVELLKLSFIELSIKGRYRLHPAIKSLLVKKTKNDQYTKLTQFYITKLSGYPVGSRKYIQYLFYEFENIAALLKRCYEIKEYSLVTELWSLISSYLFYSGKWYLMLKYNTTIQNAYKLRNDYRGLLAYQIEYIGGIYFFQNNLKKVYKLLEDSLIIAKEHDDTLALVLIKQKYGIIYGQLGELKKAEQYLLEAIKGLKIEKKRDEYFKSHAYLSLVYSKMGKHELAVKSGKIAIKGSYLLNDETIKGHTLLYLAWSYSNLNKKRLAEKYFSSSYKVMKKYYIKIGEGHALQGLGQIYIDRKDYYKGLRFLHLSEHIFKELGMKKEELNVRKLIASLNGVR